MLKFTVVNDDIILVEHHKMMHGRIIINVCDAMCWLTLGANLKVIVSNCFLMTHWNSIKTYAEEIYDVDLFDELT
jgi:hypothetical protein